VSGEPRTGSRVRLVDAPDETGRTTATLLGSLSARLGSLFLVSGADAVGSIAAGLAALGREVGATAEGRRLRQALLAGRAGANGETLWSALKIQDWISAMPPSKVLDQLRNDVALVLTTDLEETLELMPIPNEIAGAEASAEPQPALFVDYVLGLWAFARELTAAVEMLAAPTLGEPGAIVAGNGNHEPPGNLLR
jgi:hypothetical protein